jgi:two-component system, OmpR family, sensor histidine kinase VicK
MNDIEKMARELAESREREKELQRRFDDLNDFIENASIPLHWVNGSGIIIWANQAELDLLGYSKEEYIGSHIASFHADKNVIEDMLSRLTRKETLLNYPAKLRCKNGDLKTVLINSNVRWDNGKFVHTRCFTRDITQLKKAELKKVDLINELQEQNSELLRKLKSD